MLFYQKESDKSMDVKKLEARNSSLDIVRIVAVFLVNSVHFFLYNGFYSETVSGPRMFIMVEMRTLFAVCVPMFMVLTGYLMSKKELSPRYYKGIRKTLIVFGIATVACMVFKALYLKEQFDLLKLLTDTLNFKGATYSWYIEMYIGLFLIIPFLNLAYNGLKTQRSKQVLVLTFVAVAVLPSLFNTYVLNPLSWWGNPISSDDFFKLFPGWWVGIYPLAYYFTGAYIREYGIKAKTRTLIITFVISLFLFGAYNFYRSQNGPFKTGTYINWGGIETYALTVMLFVLLSRIKTDKLGIGAKWFLQKVSDLALGTYLLSYMFDRVIYYDFLNKNVTVMQDRLPFYLICVPVVFILSNLASLIASSICDACISAYDALVKLIKSQRAQNKNELWRNIIFYVLLASAVGFAIWKCFYGFGGSDESYYLTIPQRLLQGDALFRDEWNLAQMSGVLLMPFTAVYRLFAGSYEGVVLAARIYYVILHAVVTSVIYTRLRKYGYITMFGALLFFIFTPYDIMAYSYNTMALDLVVLTGVLLATANYEHKSPLIAAGVCFAGAVLCNPYLALGYVLYALCVVVHLIIKKKEISFALKSEAFALKTFIWFTVGVVILAVLFLILVLSRESIGDVMNALPKMLEDPEHVHTPLIDGIGRYFGYIYNFHPQFCYGAIAYGVMAVVMVFDKKRKLHRSVYLILSALVTMYTLVLTLPTLIASGYNSIMFPMIFVGITSYVLCEKKPRELFVTLFCLGILYSLVLSISSNQHFYCISMALAASNVASFVFLSQLMREMRETDDNLDYAVALKYASIVIVTGLICFQSFCQLTVKSNHCFWEGTSLDLLNTTITAGPAKGIKTSSTKAQDYAKINSDIEIAKKNVKGRVLMLTDKTWTYLAMDKQYGSYSPWTGAENITKVETILTRLKSYYEFNPDKVPQFVYIPKVTTLDTTQSIQMFQSMGYTLTQNDVSYQLSK